MSAFLESIEQSMSAYCEAGVGLLGVQPVNTISNIAIFISAYFAYRLIVNRHIQSLAIKILPIFVFLTGIGSTLWHGYPNVFTGIADGIFLFIFLVIALYFLLDRLVGNKIVVLLGTILFIVVQIPFQVGLLPAFNGLIPYFIIFLTGLMLFYGILIRYHGLAGQLIAILGVFAAALFFRTLDLPICASIGIGTHFLWHLLNALAFYLMVRFLIRVEQTTNNSS